ncbi:Monooxygenase [Macleaya cordata]|uniref:Ubiquinone biosynthesis monooxygenase COQ6, mitochondrial n=1 Tax=Macleaya cordata TaxID=56857 RepID=A0A200R065_MACCD|nr:Monooxygenase [Macleaya cordata]
MMRRQDLLEHGQKLGLTNNVDQYDIAIVGGGMVGMALACALSSMPLTKQLNVAIIDSNPALGRVDGIKKGELPDPRVSAITPATISLFKDVGAWQYVQEHRHAIFENMQVWDYTGVGYTRYNARDLGKEILGCVVENKVLHSSLLSCLKDKDFCKTIYPSRLTSMDLMSRTTAKEMDGTSAGTTSYNRGSLAKLDLSDGNSIYAKLVVGADGGKSRVRELARIKTTGWNYSQNAVICTVEHTDENQCAWQRFLLSGPIALLPLGDKFSNIVWTMSPTEASDRKSMSEDNFVREVNRALDDGYGPRPQSSVLGNDEKFSWEVPPKVVKVVSERMMFPLSLMHANNYASNHVVLIGDAAHTVHPLAGQGVNLGYGDAIALSKIIADGIAVGSEIGEMDLVYMQLSLLKKFEAERKTANILMMAILDGFQKAYSIDLGPLNILRAAAFNAVQNIAPLKKNIVSYATGEQKWPLFS